MEAIVPWSFGAAVPCEKKTSHLEIHHVAQMDGVMSRKSVASRRSRPQNATSAHHGVRVCMCVCACVYGYVSVFEWVAHIRRIVQSVGATLHLLSRLHNATKSYGEKMYTRTSQNATD